MSIWCQVVVVPFHYQGLWYYRTHDFPKNPWSVTGFRNPMELALQAVERTKLDCPISNKALRAVLAL